MNELDPIARPEIFDEPSWNALTPGQRVRLPREAEDRLALPLETYRALRELPSWVYYGSEHGLPPECFNELGFVLPRDRPGGGGLGGALIALVLRAWAIPRLVGMLVDRIAARRARRPVASEGEPGT